MAFIGVALTVSVLGLTGYALTSSSNRDSAIVGQVRSTDASLVESTETDASSGPSLEPVLLPEDALTGQWDLISADVEGRVVVPDKPVWLVIDGESVFGFLGCAPVSARAAIDEVAGMIRFRDIVEDTLGCPATDAQTQEILLQAVRDVRAVELRDGEPCFIAEAVHMCFEEGS